jgi:hypothetical protein
MRRIAATVAIALLICSSAEAAGTIRGGDAGGDLSGAIFAAWANSYNANANYPRSRGRLCKYRPILNVDPVANVTPWGQWTWTTTTGQIVLAWWQACDTNEDGVLDEAELADEDYYAQFVTIDPVILVGALADHQSGLIDVPTPDLSPPDEGYINLGLWLAVEDVDIAEVNARSGVNWARVWVELDTTTYDFGNGDDRTCPGAGTPIPDDKKGSVEQGPCGYTYRDAKGDYPITITANWNVWAETNARAPYIVDTVDAATTIDYPVLEIQTVGTG